MLRFEARRLCVGVEYVQLFPLTLRKIGSKEEATMTRQHAISHVPELGDARRRKKFGFHILPLPRLLASSQPT